MLSHDGKKLLRKNETTKDKCQDAKTLRTTHERYHAPWCTGYALLGWGAWDTQNHGLATSTCHGSMLLAWNNLLRAASMTTTSRSSYERVVIHFIVDKQAGCGS